MSEKIDALLLKLLRKRWSDEEDTKRHEQEFRQNATTVIQGHFGYDCSVLSEDEWSVLSTEICYHEFYFQKSTTRAIKDGFRAYVMDQGGPEVFGIEEDWE